MTCIAAAMMFAADMARTKRGESSVSPARRGKSARFASHAPQTDAANIIAAAIQVIIFLLLIIAR